MRSIRLSAQATREPQDGVIEEGPTEDGATLGARDAEDALGAWLGVDGAALDTLERASDDKEEAAAETDDEGVTDGVTDGTTDDGCRRRGTGCKLADGRG
jgi:hypothetical protein